MKKIKIPLHADWSELSPAEQRSALKMYRAARKAGYVVNDARYMVNSFVERRPYKSNAGILTLDDIMHREPPAIFGGVFHSDEPTQLTLSDAPTVRRSGQDKALESWDDEPAWVQRVAGLDGRSQLENGVLILCLLVVVYVTVQVVWALATH